MKATDPFKATIKAYLDNRAANDELFAKTYTKEGKNIDDCVTYILNHVKASGCNGFADDEIYGMAMHYYDEDKIEVGKPVSARVVVNHIELTEEEKAAAKQKALDELVVELTDEDKAIARQKALEDIIAEERRRITSKPAKPVAKPEVEQVQQPSLF